MLFPFRTSTIFRNRWVALMWAAGICFMAAQIVDTVSGVATKDKPPAPVSTNAPQAGDSSDPVAVALGNAPPPGPVTEDHIAR